MQTDEVLELLGIHGDNGKALCPAHEDEKESMSVTLTEEGKILVHCHAGCDQEEVLRGLADTYGITARDLGNGGVRQRKEVARYVYRDAGGSPLFTKIRFDPKDFVIQPAGAETGVLYGLPQILAATPAKTVVWVEGEKACEALWDKGFLATTLGGASKSPDKAVKALKGRRVVILPDNDGPGRSHADLVQRILKANGVHVVRILHLPGLPVKGDVYDWFEMGHTAEELADMLRRALGVTFAAGVSPKTTQWMWNPRIPATGVTLMFGMAGIGKSTMVTDLVARWTRGDPMPETAPQGFKPINVGMLGHEDDRDRVVVPRLVAAGADLSRVAFVELDNKKPYLPDQIDLIRQIVQENEIEMLVFDNIENSMAGGIDSNNSKSLRSALSPLSFIGVPVLAIHHPKKGALASDPREAMSGSQAYTNVARSVLEVLQVGVEPDGSKMIALLPVKSNYANVTQIRTLYFKVVPRLVEGVGDQPFVEWHGGDLTGAAVWHQTLLAEQVKNSTPPSQTLPPTNTITSTSLSATTSTSLSTTTSSKSKRGYEGEDQKDSENLQDSQEKYVTADSKALTYPTPVAPDPVGGQGGGSAPGLPPGVVPCQMGSDGAVSRIQTWVEDERRKLGMDRATDTVDHEQDSPEENA